MMLVWLCIRARELPSEDLKGRAPVWNVNKSSRRRASERKKFQINNSSHRSRSSVADNDTHQPTPESVHSRLRHVPGAVVIIRKFLLCAQQITTHSLLRERHETAWSWTQCSSTNRLNLLFQFMTYELSLFRSAFNKGKLISLCDGEMRINQWLFRDAFNPPAQDLHRREFSAAMENYFSISHVLRIPLIKIAF